MHMHEQIFSIRRRERPLLRCLVPSTGQSMQDIRKGDWGRCTIHAFFFLQVVRILEGVDQHSTLQYEVRWTGTAEDLETEIVPESHLRPVNGQMVSFILNVEYHTLIDIPLFRFLTP